MTEDTGDAAFGPADAGLRWALEQLIARTRAPGTLPPPAQDLTRLPATLPEAGLGERDALAWLAGPVLDGAMPLRHPGFLAHMDPPTPWIAWAAAQWAAAVNQNLLHPETAPVARELEERVVSWLAPAFGMDGGHLVPGSTIANLTALWAARELRGVREVVASEAAHVSVPKAARLLGLDYRAVPVDERQRLRPEELGDLSHAALVVTAGTVAAGAIDPLAAGAPAWRHVDAAWAGPLRLSARHRHLLDGVEAADSTAFSAHKWLWQPKECALVLFADTEAAHAALSFGGGYLSAPNVGVLGSHGASAVALAATLLAWGRDGVAARLDRCMAIAQRLDERVRAEPALEPFAPPVAGVVAWRAPGRDSDELQGRVRDAFVSVAELNGETWLRSVTANPLADPDHVVDRVLAALGG